MAFIRPLKRWSRESRGKSNDRDIQYHLAGHWLNHAGWVAHNAGDIGQGDI